MGLPCPVQPGLFDSSVPAFDRTFRSSWRTDLGRGAWLDVAPSWLTGHATLREVGWGTTRWQALRRRMYERVVDVPRLVGTLPDDGPGDPLIDQMAAALTERYGRSLARVSL